jgi:hypothetical protein
MEKRSKVYILSSFDHAQYSLEPQKHSALLVPYRPLGPKNTEKSGTYCSQEASPRSSPRRGSG